MSAPCEPRRGAVILIQRGDPEIAGAIARGLLEGKAAAEGTPHPSARALTPSPQGEGFWEGAQGEPPREQVEIVSAEADHWRTVAKLVRVAVGNTKTPEDYEIMLIRAKGRYGMTHLPGPVRVVAGKMMLAWALLWQGIRRAYRAQDRLLSPGSGGRCR